MKNPLMAIITFILVAYGLSAGLSLFIGLTGGHESPFILYAIAAMVFPFIAVVVMRIAFLEKVPSMGWGKFPILYLPVALLIFPIIYHASMMPLLYVLEGGFPWKDWLTPQTDGLYHGSDEWGWGEMTTADLLKKIAVNAGAGLLIVSVLAFFEEIGWRAWLLPRLDARFGVRAAVVLSALIWAFWHTPFAFSGVFHFETVSPSTTAIIMPIGHTGAGLILGWLWFRTQSIWLVSLAHGSLNNWGQYAFKYMEGASQSDAILLATGNTALLLVGVFFLFRLRG